MQRAFPRLMISAPRKSSGKTMVSIGLARLFHRRGLTVQPFKKGPDYIDPLWLSSAGGRDCHNLDLFIMGRERVRQNFVRFARSADLCLIEGNMGYCDGQDIGGEDSSAALAEWLQAPVVLVVDCQGLARSVAPLVAGHLAFPGGEHIAGVILNNVASSRQEGRLHQVLARYCPVPVLGVLPRLGAITIDERHLGLVPVAERSELAERIEQIADHVEQHVDVAALLAVAQGAPPLEQIDLPILPAAGKKCRIGYAFDQAFHFYYPENMAALRQSGAELIPVNLLVDSSLPEIDALYIGGGFPEMFMEPLAANHCLLNQLRQAGQAGLPIYAECGGLMYLAERIHWEGRSVAVAGLLPIEVAMHKRPQGHGYMELEGTGLLSWPGPTPLRCHEFHYSKVVRMGEGLSFAYKVRRGVGVDGCFDGLLYRHILASYAHIHVDGAPGWAHFLVDQWAGKKGER